MSQKMFPIQSSREYTKPFPRRIPWAVAELAYGVYSSRYGDSQSLERLAERAGFGPEEMDDFVPDWLDRCDEISQLRERIAELERENIDHIEARDALVEEIAALRRDIVDHVAAIQTHQRVAAARGEGE